ncbi:39260_t:CDS:1, partial [Gigaspora margarita]
FLVKLFIKKIEYKDKYANFKSIKFKLVDWKEFSEEEIFTIESALINYSILKFQIFDSKITNIFNQKFGDLLKSLEICDRIHKSSKGYGSIQLNE